MDFLSYAIDIFPSSLLFVVVFMGAVFPLISSILCTLFRLCVGWLYPAYASYKAVKTKNGEEYLKWMMYWIVFALFTCVETFTDGFLPLWCDLYYEIKVVLVFWLLSPVTKGSSFLYRIFVHPQLAKREKDIDEYLNRAKEQGYHAVLTLGSKFWFKQ